MEEAGAGGGGILRLSSDRDDGRTFYGVEIFILGFFWGGGEGRRILASNFLVP